MQTASEYSTDLGGGEALLGELHNLVLHIVLGELEPVGYRAAIWQGRLGYTLSGGSTGFI